MFLLKKFMVFGMILTAAGALSACDSVLFPEYDDGDVYVGDGGRVVRTVPSAGNSLRADMTNVAYEDGVVPAKEMMAEPVPAADVVKPAKTAPVIKMDKFADNERRFEEDERLTAPKAKPEKAKKAKPAAVEPQAPVMSQVAESAAEEEAQAPSVSYRIDTFLFADGSSELGGDNMQRIRQIVKEAKAHNASVVVYGYASSRTRNTDPASHKLANFKVSMERATSVANALKRAGMPAAKIEAQAMSDEAPMYQEVMPEGERLNRRAEVYISY